MKKVFNNYLEKYLIYIKSVFRKDSVPIQIRSPKKEFSQDEIDKIRYIWSEKLTNSQLKKLASKLKIYFLGPTDPERDDYVLVIDECQRKDFYSNYWEIIKNKYLFFFNSDKKINIILKKLSKSIKNSGGLGEKNTRFVFQKIIDDFFSEKIDSKTLEAVCCHLFFELNQPEEIFDFWDKKFAQALFSACNIYSFKKYTNIRYKTHPIELKKIIKKEWENIYKNIQDFYYNKFTLTR